jgi:hypothetical protein
MCETKPVLIGKALSQSEIINKKLYLSKRIYKEDNKYDAFFHDKAML